MPRPIGDHPFVILILLLGIVIAVFAPLVGWADLLAVAVIVGGFMFGRARLRTIREMSVR